MIESSLLQAVMMRGIHLFCCQAGNLEAVRALPAPGPRLTAREPQTHPSTHIPRHVFSGERQHIQITRSIAATSCPHSGVRKALVLARMPRTHVPSDTFLFTHDSFSHVSETSLPLCPLPLIRSDVSRADLSRHRFGLDVIVRDK